MRKTREGDTLRPRVANDTPATADVGHAGASSGSRIAPSFVESASAELIIVCTRRRSTRDLGIGVSSIEAPATAMFCTQFVNRDKCCDLLAPG